MYLLYLFIESLYSNNIFLEVPMAEKRSLFWFRNDLRLADNPCLLHAAEEGSVLLIYILDNAPHRTELGGASRFWLHHSLKSLAHSVKGHLCLQQGDPAAVLEKLIKKYQIRSVCASVSYEPRWMAHDKKVASLCKKL